MEGEFNIARVSEEETWERNQYNKNWGKLTVLEFHRGEPTYFLPSCKQRLMQMWRWGTSGSGLRCWAICCSVG